MKEAGGLLREAHQTNREAWNEITPVHNAHKKDQAKFLREGGTTLFPEDLALFEQETRDFSELRVVHLQCNSGQDTLSLASALRPKSITGVDISDEAIEFAKKLSEESGIEATFIRSDVFDWFQQAQEEGELFDVVFMSYGVLAWVSDIKEWAKGIFSILNPGGFFCHIDFHPIAFLFGWDLNDRQHSYFSDQNPIHEDGIGDYVGLSGSALAPSGFIELPEYKPKKPSVEFQWSLSEIIQSLIEAGFRILSFKEYPYSNGCKCFESLVPKKDQDNVFSVPEGSASMPLMFSVTASK